MLSLTCEGAGNPALPMASPSYAEAMCVILKAIWAGSTTFFSGPYFEPVSQALLFRALYASITRELLRKS